jgi:enterobacteria phage integrase
MRNLEKYQSDYEVTLRDELLAHLFEQNGYYRYKHPAMRQFVYLGNNKQVAVRLTMQLNVGLSPLDSRVVSALRHSVNNYTKSGTTFAQFFHCFQKDILPNKELSAKTINAYRYYLKRFSKEYGSYDINQISLKDISTFLSPLSPVTSNRFRAILSVFWKYAMAAGLVSDNLPAKTLKKRVIVQRERLSVDGFKAIRSYAPDWLKNAMDIALITGQRVGDIAKMKHSDIKDGFLYLKQGKTSQALKIPVIGHFLGIINRCKSNGCDNFITIDNKSITSIKISQEFSLSRKESGFYDNIQSPPTFHEIRSLSARLQKQSGIDKKITQNWLGHSSEQMTDLYLSRCEDDYQEIPKESMLTFSQLITL